MQATVPTKHVSEVAQLRQQIADEYMASKLGLQGLNRGTSYHKFITARQERIAALHGKLHEMVGDDAIMLVSETVDALPDALARSDVLEVLRRELGQTEEIECLCSDLQGIWKAIDLLQDRFGVEQARKIILASSSLQETIPPSSVLACETGNSLSGAATRSDILAVLRSELGKEESEICGHALQEAWKAVDTLLEKIADEQARKIVLAPSSSLIQKIPPS